MCLMYTSVKAFWTYDPKTKRRILPGHKGNTIKASNPIEKCPSNADSTGSDTQRSQEHQSNLTDDTHDSQGN